jgi:hypothetical protein
MNNQTKTKLKQTIIKGYILFAFIAFFGNLLFEILSFYFKLLTN